MAIRPNHNPAPKGSFGQATEADLYYCYRLLLEREPDPAGWATWRSLIDRKAIKLRELTAGFLQSDEYRRLRSLTNDPAAVALDGFTIYVRPLNRVVGRTIVTEREYEPHVTRALRSRLAPGSVFVDIGANVGYFTLLAASLVGEAGRVVAFEPNPDNRALLARSLAANGFANVIVHPFAVADRPRTIPLRLHNDGTSLVGEPPVEPALIEAVALDEFLADLERIDVLKIDIDGGEPPALAGMRGLLRRCRPVVFSEFCPALLREAGLARPEALLEDLVALGYRLAVIGRDDGPVDPTAIVAACERVGVNHLDLVAEPF
jgi:FkbM family methyltransferase